MAHERFAAAQAADTAAQPQLAFLAIHKFSLLLVQASDSDEALLCSTIYSVATAADPAAVLTQLEAGRIPDLIMADWQGSAQELLQELKSSEQWRDIPVIVTSTESGPETVLAAIRAGAADFLVKPLRRNEVSTLWQHAWRRRAAITDPSALQQQQPHALPPSSAAAAPAAKALLKTNSNSGSESGGSVAASAGSHSSAHSSGDRFSVPASPPLAAAVPQRSSATVTSPQQQPAAQPAAQTLNPDTAADSPFRRAASPPLASLPSPCRSAPAGVGAVVIAADDDVTAMEVDSAAAVSLQQQQRQLPQARHSFDMAAGPSTSGRPAARAALLPQAFSHLRSLCAPRSLSGDLAVDLSIRPLDVTPPPASPGSMGSAPHLAPPGAFSTPSSGPKPGAAVASPAAAPAPPSQQQLPSAPTPPPPTARPQPAAHGRALPAAPAPGTQAQADHRAVCAANRRAAIAKFRQKREQRNFDKKVRYVSRKRLAESRPRVRGQFVKAEVAAACRALADVQDGMPAAAGMAVAA